MFIIVGTVPSPNFPLVIEQAILKAPNLQIGKHLLPINRGTPALVAAASQVCALFNLPAPIAVLVGDTGLGQGSRKLYSYLAEKLQSLQATTLVFHYLQPDVDWHNKVLMAIDELPDRPNLIADAGFMYAAKMSGFASKYDLFTPDMGELAFLADETAPHPFYTRGFILHEDNKAPELIERAYKYKNAAQNLLVKGRSDVFASAKGVHWEVDSPAAEAMEAIGGTGDTLTGIATALIEAGQNFHSACKQAAVANRKAGQLTSPTPATQIMDIISAIPEAVRCS